MAHIDQFDDFPSYKHDHADVDKMLLENVPEVSTSKGHGTDGIFTSITDYDTLTRSQSFTVVACSIVHESSLGDLVHVLS